MAEKCEFDTCAALTMPDASHCSYHSENVREYLGQPQNIMLIDSEKVQAAFEGKTTEPTTADLCGFEGCTKDRAYGEVTCEYHRGVIDGALHQIHKGDRPTTTERIAALTEGEDIGTVSIRYLARNHKWVVTVGAENNMVVQGPSLEEALTQIEKNAATLNSANLPESCPKCGEESKKFGFDEGALILWHYGPEVHEWIHGESKLMGGG